MQAAEDTTADARREAMLDAERRKAACAHLCAALRACEPEDAAQIMAAALDGMGAGAPRTPFDDPRSDAEWWADTATPPELEAYVAAGLRRVERRAFCERARKRLLVALWETMPVAWRAEFLRKVDPDGRFYRRAS